MTPRPAADGTLNPAGIRGVLFDVDGTLYIQWPVRLIVLSILIAKHALAPARLVRVLNVIRKYRAMQELLRHDVESGKGGPERQAVMTAAATGESEEFVERTVEEWMRQRPLPFLRYFLRPGASVLLRGLQERGYRLGAYSDYPCGEKLVRMTLADYFSFAASSFDRDILTFKPGRTGFLACARRMGLEPGAVLYIGDREHADAAGAQRSGMQAVLVGGMFLRFLRNPLRPRKYRSFHAIRKTMCDRS